MATTTYTWTNAVDPFFVNTITAGIQASPAVASFTNGNYFSVRDLPLNVEGRILGSGGTAVTGEFQVNSTTANNQFDAAIATLVNGNAAVVFTDTSVDAGGDIRARLFSPTGTAVNVDFGVDTGTGDDTDADVAALADGGFVVSYTREIGAGDFDIRSAIFNADGSARGSVVLVDSSTALNTNSSSVAGLTGGNFVVAWEQQPTAGGDTEVFYRIHNSSGTAVTGATLIDTAGSINVDIQVVALQDGGFAVAYVDNGWALSGTEITLRIYNADGSLRADNLLPNTNTAGDQSKPSLAVLQNGFIVVSWNDGNFTVYQAFTPSGARVGDNIGAFNESIEAEIASLGAGLVAGVRSSTVTDGSGDQSIRSSVIELTRTITGDGTNETLTGDSLRDTILGGGGNDLLDGRDGNDHLDGGADSDMVTYANAGAGVTVNLGAGTASGGAGADTLVGFEDVRGSSFADALIGNSLNNYIAGGAGNDRLDGGLGDDYLDAGADSDMVDYASAGAGVTVNLATGTASGGAGIDTLLGFEDLRGSSFADVLTGNALGNYVDGGAGNDRLDGGSGADYLDGGAGTDMVNYASAGAFVTVNLGAGTASGGAGSDTLVGLEDLHGTGFDDALTGSSLNNNMIGAGGNDYLAALEGNDSLEGGPGADYLDGGAGTDLVDYSSAGAFVTVNLGAGTVSGGAGSDTLLGLEDVLGSGFDDALNGSSLNNYMRGGGGNDYVAGLAGNDRLDGGSGNDYLDGGADSDMVDYASAGAGVTVNLATGTTSGGAGVDTLLQFEDLRGSSFADTLTGNALGNYIEGGAGNDRLDGGLGADYMDAGAGSDIADYTSAGGAVVVNLGTGTASGSAGADILVGFEDLQGSGFDDDLIGNTLNNYIAGAGGNDYVAGGVGDDYLDAGTGHDYLVGGAGADSLVGNVGQDTFVLAPGDGGNALNLADIITDYQDGTDSIGLGGGLTFAGLTITQGTGANVNDAVIQRTSTGEYLAIVQNVSAATLDALDFKPVA